MHISDYTLKEAVRPWNTDSAENGGSDSFQASRPKRAARSLSPRPVPSIVSIRTRLIPSAGDSLDAYLQAVNEIPPLTAGEELRLVERMRGEQDAVCARMLVLSNLRFVVHIALEYRDYRQPFDDLVQEGNLGLLKALEHFTPNRGVRLSFYAIPRIRAEICQFILNNRRIVKTVATRAQQNLFFKLQKVDQSNLRQSEAGELRRVADELRASLRDVLDLSAQLAECDVSIANAARNDGQGYSPEEYLADPNNGVVAIEEADWNEWLQIRMREVLANLDQRSREIFRQRWLTPGAKAKLRELAQAYGLSGERIRQIEQQIFGMLRAQAGC